MAALVAVIPKQQLNMAAGTVAMVDMQSTNYSDLLFLAQNARIFFEINVRDPISQEPNLLELCKI